MMALTSTQETHKRWHQMYRCQNAQASHLPRILKAAILLPEGTEKNGLHGRPTTNFYRYKTFSSNLIPYCKAANTLPWSRLWFYVWVQMRALSQTEQNHWQGLLVHWEGSGPKGSESMKRDTCKNCTPFQELLASTICRIPIERQTSLTFPWLSLNEKQNFHDVLYN